ncbi:dynein light chain Tctex-type protein 2B-like isoform X2 [Ruditapes philippinarum]|uniref:dynein light chain Tctex-type protein 2B-like isoform X2 n=1 Tax=Ruditapes philippinarum TaxID=129788 RepID=UPI00295ACFBC|nr:dynein light chain Tctex-type protein 2B-like isoform X2 [Ruditapes philippinarum]
MWLSQKDIMTNIPLGGKVSSLFDVPERRELQPHGSSITSFAWEPHEDGPRKAKKIYYENTYKMEPPEKFRPDKVRPIIEKVLATNLKGRKYDPTECSLLSKALSDDIKHQVRALKFDRYKIIALVTVGQKTDQSVSVGSRFLWDADRDNFAAASWCNKHVYAVGTVYAVYYE